MSRSLSGVWKKWRASQRTGQQIMTMNLSACTHSASVPLGILLAAGRGTRFDPSGEQNKLLARLTRGPDAGEPVAFAAARHLCAALPRVIAVVRPDGAGAAELARLLTLAGCEVFASEDAQRGMGASLAAAVRYGGPAAGWVVALADMPMLEPATVRAVSAALVSPASMAAACYQGRRGHPVGFGAAYRSALARLDGDRGARSVLEAGAVTLIETEDPGVLHDVDTPQAL
jgi:molybdenum cofactor cytidylyltransferase